LPERRQPGRENRDYRVYAPFGARTGARWGTICVVAQVTVLDREMFGHQKAAGLLRVHPSTLWWWLEGGRRRGKIYRPVIRPEPTGSKSVTWGEFVEAGLLRQYRRVHDVKLSELRGFIDAVRQQLGVPYPLAHQRPFVGPGRTLMLELQDELDLSADLCLVAVASGQLVLTGPAQAFLARVEWSEDVPEAWRPHDDELSPVRMRPSQRFGLPSVHGVRTEVLWEQVEAGADVEEVADDFNVSPADVRWALSYENSTRAAA
jgi:uncharacterized protein (DUF433 family)